MPWFEYEGQCPNGTAIAGRVEAESYEAAQAMLRDTMRITLTEIRAATSPRPKGTISHEDFLFFNEQLASLASAGIALDEGLQQLAHDVKSRRLRKFIDAVISDLRRGEPIEQAVAKHESRLPVLYSQVLRAGVQTGQLSATLLGLNQHLRLMGQTRQVLWETLTYPAFVLALGLAVVSFFFLMVVPQFKSIFSDFGTSLPGPTVLLLEMSDAYPTILIVGGILVFGAALCWQLLRTTRRGRTVREVIICHFPILGQVYRASLICRFVRSVATSVQIGIPLPEALRLAGGVTGSPGLAAETGRVADTVEQGGSVFEATQLCALIPSLFGYTVQVAIGREALPSALMQLAETYESRALHYQTLLRVVLFPAVVVLIGLVMAIGVIGLFLPLVTLINSVSGG